MSLIALNTRYRKLFAIVWALIEILLFAGLFFGWGTLVFMLKEEGVYGHLCENEAIGSGHRFGVSGLGTVNEDQLNLTTVGYEVYSTNVTHGFKHNNTGSTRRHNVVGCPAQDKVFNLGFTMVSGLWPFFYGLLGQLGHRFGTRFLRLSSILSFISGSLFVAFTTPELPWLAFIGLFMYGISGCSLLFSNFQLSYLFTRGRLLVCSLMTGSFDSSIATQLYIKMSYDSGIERRSCYIFIACLHTMAFISTFLWLPKTYIDLPETTDETIVVHPDEEEEKMNDKDGNGQPIGLEQRKCGNATKSLNNCLSTEQGDASILLSEQPVVTKDADLSLRGHLCSNIFLMHVFWYSILQLRFFYFVGTLNPWLERVSQSEEEVSRYTDISMFFMLGGIITSFIAGSFSEMQKRRYKDSKSSRKRKTGPVLLPLIVGTALGVLLSVMQMISVEGAIYASFISVTFFRSFLYAIGNGYLSEMFPSKYFSSLSGILMVLTGTASFFQYLFFYWTESYSGAYLHVDIVLVGIVLTSLAHPIYQWLQCRKLD
ncbi:solute carrier family 43 member 3-like [Mizuhopecten yessoensis]|uniref:solute carrier family 43 member 3-like n=1 Tax=Mizuhopecten yessoensis TaxID=6573 RepID=UPI000B459C04|nr:solute carrier family 43 member 3-like [Mizuhopecten yessoensis]